MFSRLELFEVEYGNKYDLDNMQSIIFVRVLIHIYTYILQKLSEKLEEIFS